MSHRIIIIAGPNGAVPAFYQPDLIAAGLRNFDQHYKSKVDAWALYDNAGTAPVLLEWRKNT